MTLGSCPVTPRGGGRGWLTTIKPPGLAKLQLQKHRISSWLWVHFLVLKKYCILTTMKKMPRCPDLEEDRDNYGMLSYIRFKDPHTQLLARRKLCYSTGCIVIVSLIFQFKECHSITCSNKSVHYSDSCTVGLVLVLAHSFLPGTLNYNL